MSVASANGKATGKGSGEHTLDSLAAKIREEHERGEVASRKGLVHFRNAGSALLEAKELCPHGEWLDWLENKAQLSERRAQRYMKLAKSDAASDLEKQWKLICGHNAQKKAATKTKKDKKADITDDGTEPLDVRVPREKYSEFCGMVGDLLKALKVKDISALVFRLVKDRYKEVGHARAA